MTRVVLAAGVVVWLGATLALSELRWFRRRRLIDRLLPYLPGSAASERARVGGWRSLASARQMVAPTAQELGDRLARLFGVSEGLAARLERVHADDDMTTFRTRQLGWSVAGLAGAVGVCLAIRPPALVAVVLVAAGPLLAFLVVEQRLVHASSDWQRRVFLELPVTCEQLGMLLSAGYSLGGALNRIASRGHGACARDLARVCGRLRQGLADVDALREWAAVVDIEAVHRLVGVLALNREAGDLGTLITHEARTVRQDVQRELIETIERRSQQVWIPVTVATLLPGVIFLAVPFIEAMSLFSSG